MGYWRGYLTGARCKLAQRMPLPLTVSCFSKIQIGFTFLVPAHLGSPGQRAVKRVLRSQIFSRYRSPPSPAMDPPLVLQWLECWTRDSKSRRFDPRPSRFQVTTLGKLFAHMAGMSPLPGAFQVPPCDPIWRASSRSCEACCELIYTVYLYLFTRAPVSKQYNSVPIKRR